VPSFTPQGMLVSFESPKETRASITTAPLPVNSASDTSVCPVPVPTSGSVSRPPFVTTCGQSHDGLNAICRH
jgi:hypothetical protein